MKIRNVFYIGFTLLIIACSSTPISTSYYLLNNQPSTFLITSEKSPEEKLNQVIVVSIKDLPEYLEQSHLVMQMADHQLHYANFHMWAEPLKQGLEKALLADLISKNSTINFVAEKRDLKQDNLTKLFVNVDFFHATADSKVVLSGSYWLESTEKNGQYNNQSFHFELQLDKDGFPHSVEKMRALVDKLAKQVVNGI